MKLIALCGAAGAGKDTVADMLPARKLAFADTLYAEVAAAWGVTVARLKLRDLKETEQECFALDCVAGSGFDSFIRGRLRASGESEGQTAHSVLTTPRSPRQILQRWGDYRRAQDPDYFVTAARKEVLFHWAHESIVLTDVRFPNEAAMIRQLGGQIWQIKRPGYEAGGTCHESDNDGSQFNPDRIIYNNGTLLELRQTVMKEFSQ